MKTNVFAQPMPRRITADFLADAGACRDAVQDFLELWPDGAEINRHNLAAAAQIGLNINWFVAAFVSSAAWQPYHEARIKANMAYCKAIADESPWCAAHGVAVRGLYSALATALADLLDLPPISTETPQ